MADEQAWIRGLRNGEAEALRAVYAAYKDELFSLALVLGRDRALAEDALQDVFVDLARKGHTLKIRDNLKRYLATCVANRVRAAFRRKRPDVSWVEDSLSEDRHSPEAHLTQQESAVQISAALATLPLEQREVVVLHLHSDLTFKAIAHMQDVSINTVQSRYRYGLTKLRTLLNGEMER